MALANFIRDGSTSTSLLVNFSVSGSATFNTDYTVTFPPGITGTWTATTGSVTLPIGTSQVDVTLTPTGDSTLEQDETVIINLTSTVPTIPISSVNGAAIYIIVNDDFTTKLKVLGVTTAGTALVGTISGSLSGNNIGVAPANWTNWLVNTTTGPSAIQTAPGLAPQSYPILIKEVLRSPSSTPASAGILRYCLTEGSFNNWALFWVSNASGTWDLAYAAQSITTVTLLAPNYAPNVWVDVCLTQEVSGVTLRVGATTTLSSATVTGLWNLVNIRHEQGAFAALNITNGQNFSPSMFPITPANL
jgi:hypothetical protein